MAICPIRQDNGKVIECSKDCAFRVAEITKVINEFSFEEEITRHYCAIAYIAKQSNNSVNLTEVDDLSREIKYKT